MSTEINNIPDIINSANLKAYYRFESGALTTDSSGEGHTLTAIGTPVEDASGKFGGAVALNGSSAYSAVDHSDFKPTGNFTVGAWVKTSTTGATQMIFQSRSNNTNVAGWVLYVNNVNTFSFQSGKNTGTVSGTDFQTVNGSNTVTNGILHFAVATWDGTNLNIYRDGIIDATAVAWANAPAYAATNYVRAGCRNQTGTNDDFFTGSLDDVFLIKGTALSADTIASIYDGTILSPSTSVSSSFSTSISSSPSISSSISISISSSPSPSSSVSTSPSISISSSQSSSISASPSSSPSISISSSPSMSISSSPSMSPSMSMSSSPSSSVSASPSPTFAVHYRSIKRPADSVYRSIKRPI